MSGRATFTIVMSIALMNIATQMTPRPLQRLAPTRSRAEEAEKWVKCGSSMLGGQVAGRAASIVRGVP